MEKASFQKPHVRTPQPGFMVKALVLDQSTLNTLTSSRNIVDFFAESLSELIRGEHSPDSVAGTAQQCRASMEKLLLSANGSLGNDVVVILKEFLMEIDSVCKILSERDLATEIPVQLEGKMYKARYLSNVLGSETAELRRNRK